MEGRNGGAHAPPWRITGSNDGGGQQVGAGARGGGRAEDADRGEGDGGGDLLALRVAVDPRDGAATRMAGVRSGRSSKDERGGIGRNIVGMEYDGDVPKRTCMNVRDAGGIQLSTTYTRI